jgi:hypothetical protein
VVCHKTYSLNLFPLLYPYIYYLVFWNRIRECTLRECPEINNNIQSFYQTSWRIGQRSSSIAWCHVLHGSISANSFCCCARLYCLEESQHCQWEVKGRNVVFTELQ